jgi:hypothetical protein
MNSKSEQSFASTKTLDVSTISSDDFDSLYKQEEAENNVVIIFHSCTVMVPMDFQVKKIQGNPILRMNFAIL